MKESQLGGPIDPRFKHKYFEHINFEKTLNTNLLVNIVT